MNDREYALHRLTHGAQFPYDAPDAWWESDETRVAPKPTDWAHAAARGVIADLEDRRGIKREFEGLGEGIRAEIVKSLADIIRIAKDML